MGSNTVRRWGAIIISAFVAAVVYAAPDPDGSLRSRITFHDFGHVVAFGLVTVVLAFAMPARRLDGRERVRSAGLWATVALGIGAAVELAQALTGGNGDSWDIVRDAGGVSCAALIWLAADRRTALLRRTLLGTVALAVLVACSLPTLTALVDEARARRQFPVLVSFERAVELSRFEFDEHARATLESLADEENHAVQGMRVRLPPARYPGFSLTYFPRDWRSMRVLQLLLVNPNPTEWTMNVRIDDAAYDFRLDITDRYNRAFVLQPGPNRIEIPLTEIAVAPRSRPFDLGRVKMVLVHAIDLSEPREILVGPIALK